tara:strand:+ start:9226 stop:9888 length:663 start_codon:yes stop_codon:yes gene_type:complete
MDVCPVNSVCFDKNTFLLIAVAGIVIVTHFIGKLTDRLHLLERDVHLDKSTINNKMNSYSNYLDKLADTNSNSSVQVLTSEIPTSNIFYNRVYNPLTPPERTYPYTVRNVPINIPTRGPSSGFQQIGVLIQEDGVGNQQTKLPLYGQQLYPRSREWNYYIGSDGFQSIKLPITYKGRNSMDRNGCSEIYDGSVVNVDGYDSAFKATIYKLDAPKYLPHVI